jgi:hypothetical protein
MMKNEFRQTTSPFGRGRRQSGGRGALPPQVQPFRPGVPGEKGAKVSFLDITAPKAISGLLAATRRLIVATFIVQGILTCPMILGQGPLVEKPPEKPGAKNEATEKPSIEFLKPLINVELSFVKRVCEPTDEQMAAIIAAARNAHQAMGNIIDNPRVNRNVFDRSNEVFLGPNQERLSANPYIWVRRDVERFLKPLVSAEQYARYIEELDAREKYEREAAIAILLELLDDKLHLSQDQQAKLHEEFLFGTNFPDLNSMNLYIQNPQYLPNLNGYAVEPILNNSQKLIWKSLSQTHFAQRLQTNNNTGFKEEWLK